MSISKSQIVMDAAARLGVPVADFSVARSEMPQIRSADLPAFVDYAESRGVGVSRKSVLAKYLRFKQPVDAAHARAMPAEVLAKPVLVSSDLIVLDGNHRAAANAVLDNRQDVYIVHLPFCDAVDFVFDFPGVMDLKQSVAVRGR